MGIVDIYLAEYQEAVMKFKSNNFNKKNKLKMTQRRLTWSTLIPTDVHRHTTRNWYSGLKLYWARCDISETVLNPQ